MKSNNRDFTQINMNRSVRAVCHTARAAWIESPLKGVWRKPLEREAAESGQVTSLVRYDPGSEFNEHYHPNGEEIFVLDGVFEDEWGRYPAGSYLRNPPCSSHRPRSPEGCQLFVKLNMFQSADKYSVCINTEKLSWLPGQAEGLSHKRLHQFKQEHTSLIRWRADTHLQLHTHSKAEEILVLKGTLEDEHDHYPEGTWVRYPENSHHAPHSREGCILLVKTGHF